MESFPQGAATIKEIAAYLEITGILPRGRSRKENVEYVKTLLQELEENGLVDKVDLQ